MTATATRTETPLDAAQQRLVESAMRFAFRQAHRWADAMLASRPWLRREEVVEQFAAAGMGGLCEAARRFRPERGVKFITYASWWIRNAMQGEMPHWHTIGPSFCPRPNGRARSDAGRTHTIIRAGTDDNAGEIEPLARELDPESRGALEFQELLAMCWPREAGILARLFRDGATHGEVAQEMGLSKQRVVQLAQRGMERIRERLRA